MNYLISPEAGAGSACELAVALKRMIPLEAYYMSVSGYGLDWIFPGKIGYTFPDGGEHLIIMTVYAYEQIVQRRGAEYFNNFSKVTVIIPDGMICNDPDGYRRKFERFNVFTTLCKKQYYPEAREYVQPFDLSYFETKKHPHLTVCHTPFCSVKKREKSTDKILRILSKTTADVKLITGQTWVMTVSEKAKCHILVDQLPGTGQPYLDGWIGGVGKSGYEAMLLKTMVISYGRDQQYKEIPCPPVAWTDHYNAEQVIRYYICNPNEREEMAIKQYLWAKKYCNPDYQAKRII